MPLGPSRSGERLQVSARRLELSERELEESEDGAVRDHVEQVAVLLGEREPLGRIAPSRLDEPEMCFGQRSGPQAQVPRLVVARLDGDLDELLGVLERGPEGAGPAFELGEEDEGLPQDRVVTTVDQVAVGALEGPTTSDEVARPHQLRAERVPHARKQGPERGPAHDPSLDRGRTREQRRGVETEHELRVRRAEEGDHQRRRGIRPFGELDRASPVLRAGPQVSTEDLDIAQVGVDGRQRGFAPTSRRSPTRGALASR